MAATFRQITEPAIIAIKATHSAVSSKSMISVNSCDESADGEERFCDGRENGGKSICACAHTKEH